VTTFLLGFLGGMAGNSTDSHVISLRSAGVDLAVADTAVGLQVLSIVLQALCLHKLIKMEL
jgi:hypothetical protein